MTGEGGERLNGSGSTGEKTNMQGERPSAWWITGFLFLLCRFASSGGGVTQIEYFIYVFRTDVLNLLDQNIYAREGAYGEKKLLSKLRVEMFGQSTTSSSDAVFRRLHSLVTHCRGICPRKSPQGEGARPVPYGVSYLSWSRRRFASFLAALDLAEF